MPNHCYYLAISFTNHLYLYSYIYSLAMHLRYSSAPLVDITDIALPTTNSASEADYQSCSIEISDNRRASVVSETLTGVTQLKIGDVCVFICMDVRMSFCALTLSIFVFAPRSTPSQTSLNRILWFTDHYGRSSATYRGYRRLKSK